MTVEDAGRQHTQHLAGRGREVAVLSRALDETEAGHASCVVLVGEPGIGKTRLAEAVAALAASRGFAVGWGHCRAGEAAGSDPWSQVLAGLAGLGGLGRSGADGAPLPAWAGVAAQLRAAAVRQPVLAVLDDVQDDPVAAEGVTTVVPDVAGARVVIVVACRDDAVLREGGGWPSQALRLALNPLGPLAIADQVEHLTGDRPSPGAVARIAESSHGNPARTEDVALELLTRSAPAAGRLVARGELWTLELGPTVLHLRDCKGLRYLAQLLARPGREQHALDLVAAVAGTAAVAPRGRATSLVGLDDDARSAYEHRLRDIAQEIDEADADNDIVRAARLRLESEVLRAELSRAFGLGGQPRPIHDDAERARVSVTKAVRAALRRVTALDAGTGRYLNTTIRTGLFCMYDPDPRFPVEWELDSTWH